MKLLIATHNPAKKRELGEGFVSLIPSGVKFLSLDDLRIKNDPKETGKTFLENARLKAHYFAKLSNLPTVADDGGIEIDALAGKPGVHSKRWLGRDATDKEMIDYTMQQLRDIPVQKRTAQFTVCLYYYNPLTGFETSVTEYIKGHISSVASDLARKGFPYRAVFIVDTYNKYYDELSGEEHAAVNHRLKAVKKLTPFIKEDLLQ